VCICVFCVYVVCLFVSVFASVCLCVGNHKVLIRKE